MSSLFLQEAFTKARNKVFNNTSRPHALKQFLLLYRLWNKYIIMHLLVSRASQFTSYVSNLSSFPAASSNLELVLSSSSAWSTKYKDVVSADDTRTPECAEAFMILLSVMTGMSKLH